MRNDFAEDELVLSEVVMVAELYSEELEADWVPTWISIWFEWFKMQPTLYYRFSKPS